MTVEELLKQQQLGQGGASQYLSMPQQQYGGAGQYLGGLLSPELNFNAPTGTMYPQYATPTYTPSINNVYPNPENFMYNFYTGNMPFDNLGAIGSLYKYTMQSTLKDGSAIGKNLYDEMMKSRTKSNT